MQLSLVLPCYNEEEVLEETSAKLLAIFEKLIQSSKIDENSTIYFVDDGSKDKTWKIIQELTEKNKHISGIKLSRNFGHQNALLAALMTVEGDAVISIDADLQDDTSMIEKMVDLYYNGHEVVYGVKKKRESDSTFKRITAEGFYKAMRLMGVNIVYNHADFRLLSRRALEHLKEYKEVNLFLRGLIPLLGFESTTVTYDISERMAGESKYPLRKMLSFAWNGISSFSVTPLRFISAIGFILFISTLILTIYSLWIALFTDEAVPGWASTVLPIYFIGGVQMLSLGIIGEYIGKIYLEIKARPRYIIEKNI
ncbi:MAG TPA: glycosyltransferase [Sulfurovum sp.]|nr:glycosyltransferase [Sulfurovum sp.]